MPNSKKKLWGYTGVNRFRRYLESRYFILQMDSKPLLWARTKRFQSLQLLVCNAVANKLSVCFWERSLIILNTATPKTIAIAMGYLDCPHLQTVFRNLKKRHCYTQMSCKLLLLTEKEIRRLSCQDSTLLIVIDLIQKWWPETCLSAELQPFLTGGKWWWYTKNTLVGQSSGCTIQATEADTAVILRRSHRHVEDEGACTQLPSGGPT